MQSAETRSMYKGIRAAGLVGAGIAVALVCWLLALYPLVPSTARGWSAAIVSGLLAIAWAGACSAALLWLQKRRRHGLLFKAIGVMLALSLGAGIFAAAFEARAFLSANFSYFGR